MTHSPHPIDVYVGGRVRLRRMMIGMSQEKLGEALKLTFQQVQKYEKGANRIGASRLFTIASILDVPVQYFFEGVESVTSTIIPEAEDAEDHSSEVLRFIRSSEGLKLNISFGKIKSDATRKAMVNLVKTLS